MNYMLSKFPFIILMMKLSLLMTKYVQKCKNVAETLQWIKNSSNFEEKKG